MLACAILFILAPAARAVLDAPVDTLTLPQLVKEFKSIETVRARKVDLEKGFVVWSRVDQLQGKTEPADIKHLLRIHGKVPPALEHLKEGQLAVFFSSDGWDRGIILVQGCWYVVADEPDSHWWRIAYTDRHYDLNIAFAGTPEELAAAIKTLLEGNEAAVQCRIKPGEAPLQTVRYTMRRPKEKITVKEPTTRRSG